MSMESTMCSAQAALFGCIEFVVSDTTNRRPSMSRIQSVVCQPSRLFAVQLSPDAGVVTQAKPSRRFRYRPDRSTPTAFPPSHQRDVDRRVEFQAGQ